MRLPAGIVHQNQGAVSVTREKAWDALGRERRRRTDGADVGWFGPRPWSRPVHERGTPRP
ncbi:hypothetical protein BJF83_08030 [Nocardiopsis sp. CNR-923]|nr:hypothetical protein BJF83_08030 [Nocardiopsis sp. CNR-923]